MPCSQEKKSLYSAQCQAGFRLIRLLYNLWLQYLNENSAQSTQGSQMIHTNNNNKKNNNKPVLIIGWLEKVKAYVLPDSHSAIICQNCPHERHMQSKLRFFEPKQNSLEQRAIAGQFTFVRAGSERQPEMGVDTNLRCVPKRTRTCTRTYAERRVNWYLCDNVETQRNWKVLPSILCFPRICISRKIPRFSIHRCPRTFVPVPSFSQLFVIRVVQIFLRRQRLCTEKIFMQTNSVY